MERRGLAISLARGRIAIGVVSLLAPGFVARTMTGRAVSEGETRLFARMVGARDLGLGSGCSSPWTAARLYAAGSRRPPR